MDNREAEPGSTGIMQAAGDQAAPLVFSYGHAEHGRKDRNRHLVVEHLEKPRDLLVAVVGIDGNIVDELGK